MTKAVREQGPLLLWLLLVVGMALGSLSRQLIALLGLVGLVWLPFRARQWWAALGFPAFTALWLMMTVPILLSLPDAVDPAKGGRVAVRYLSYWLAAGLLLSWSLAPDQRRALVVWSGAALALLCVHGILQGLFGSSLGGEPLYEGSRYGARITGFLGVDYGWVMAVLSPFVLEACRLSDPRGRLYWVAVPLLVAAVLLSGSRASMLVMLAGWLLYGVCLLRAGRGLSLRFALPLLAGLAVAVAVLLLSPLMQQRWHDALGVLALRGEALDQALSLRPALWRAAMDVFSQHWLNGVGVRGFGTLAAPVLDAVEGLPEKEQGWWAHLALLEVATATGIIGLFGYALLCTALLALVLRAPSIALAPGLSALLALFPLGSTLPMYSMRVAAATWCLVTLTLLLANDDVTTEEAA